MTITSTVKIAAASSLADLNTIVAQNEGLHGPLTAMGNDGSFTLLTFDNSPTSPKNSAVIAPQKDGKPVLPTGAALVCIGTIFIQGQLTLSSASRMP
ncbi:MAG TPA: hypothetical protein VNH44_12780 [Micropepsaceae bacterium]|nr:hypothetical protein [Micropepsaceae bacterium]